MGDTSRTAMAAQYGDDRNLAARQAIYRYVRSATDFHEWALSFASLEGGERVVDLGCGNRRYLQRLTKLGHRGPMHGLDLSPGMGPDVAGDIAALPMRTACADVALCMHALYHVPDRAAGVAELRRVVRPGGRAVVVTNSIQHFREVDDLVAELTGKRPMRMMLAFTMEDGEGVLRASFDHVEAHPIVGALDVLDAEAVVAYVGSVRDAYGVSGEALDEVRAHVSAAIERDGVFTITTASGAFVCS